MGFLSRSSEKRLFPICTAFKLSYYQLCENSNFQVPLTIQAALTTYSLYYEADQNFQHISARCLSCLASNSPLRCYEDTVSKLPVGYLQAVSITRIISSTKSTIQRILKQQKLSYSLLSIYIVSICNPIFDSRFVSKVNSLLLTEL